MSIIRLSYKLQILTLAIVLYEIFVEITYLPSQGASFFLVDCLFLVCLVLLFKLIVVYVF